MPRLYRFLKWAAALCVAAIILRFPLYVWGIVLSLWRSEAAMIYWVDKVGCSQKVALIIAIAISTISICTQVLGTKGPEEWVRKFLRKHSSQMKNLLGIHPAPPRLSLAPLIPCPESNFPKLAKRFRYYVLPLFCLDPFFGIASGVVFIRSWQLNINKALLVMLLSNLAEKLLWSYALRNIYPTIKHVAMPIVFILLGITIGGRIIMFLHENGRNH